MDYQDQRKLALKLFKGEKYKELRDAIKAGKCFVEILPIAEKAGAIEFWDKFIDEWKYYAGFKWFISKEMIVEAFLKLKEEEWEYHAGCDWGIPREILIKAFPKLKGDEWIYWAGCDWTIPKKILIKAFLKLKEAKWIFWARRDWAFPEKMLKDAILNGHSS